MQGPLDELRVKPCAAVGAFCDASVVACGSFCGALLHFVFAMTAVFQILHPSPSPLGVFCIDVLYFERFAERVCL
jgi:hypothetical protein